MPSRSAKMPMVNVLTRGAFDGQQRLMLLGTQPHFRCCAFAELQKTT
jgi:hypothetical protein